MPGTEAGNDGICPYLAEVVAALKRPRAEHEALWMFLRVLPAVSLQSARVRATRLGAAGADGACGGRRAAGRQGSARLQG